MSRKINPRDWHHRKEETPLLFPIGGKPENERTEKKKNLKSYKRMIAKEEERRKMLWREKHVPLIRKLFEVAKETANKDWSGTMVDLLSEASKRLLNDENIFMMVEDDEGIELAIGRVVRLFPKLGPKIKDYHGEFSAKESS